MDCNQAPDLTVSVCIITYNHARFIRQAIDSVLAQEARFNIEILIGEDSSTDGTHEIALEYEHAYPEAVRVITHLREDVIYVNDSPTGRWNFLDTLSMANGKYVAFLEGDDYWTDPEKLQKQVDIMESRPDFMMCGHWCTNVNDRGELLKNQLYTGESAPQEISAKHALSSTTLHPNTWLFRNFDLVKHQGYSLLLTLPAGDDPLFLILLCQGKGYCIQDFMSAYRVHDGGTWSSKSSNRKACELLQYQLSVTKLVPPRLLVFAIWQSSYSLSKFILSAIVDFAKGKGEENSQELIGIIKKQRVLSKNRIASFILISGLLLPLQLPLFLMAALKRIKSKAYEFVD